MLSTKRVILADGSRLLREMLHQVIDKAASLEVVQEVLNPQELSAAINQFDPEWVVISMPFSEPEHHWVRTCLAKYPSVRFMFLSPYQQCIEMKWHTVYEENYSDLSLDDFIHILEKDLQRT